MNTYETAINEYESEDENGQYKLIYAYFGLAVYFSQCLEETFSIMLSTSRIHKREVKTNKEINDIIDAIENSKKTMGNFINEVKQNYNLPEELKKGLETILKKRNYLIHKYFKVEIQKFYSNLGRKEMLQYFCNFIDDSKGIDKRLKYYYSDYTKKLGLTEEKIEQMIKEMKTQEIKRERKNI